MKKAIVTGISGQDGAYLAKLLLDKGYDVTGVVRSNAQYRFSRLEHLGIKQDIRFTTCNLTEQTSVFRLIRDNPVDEVYNLAANSFVGSSWDDPVNTADVNGLGVVRLLDSLRTLAPETRFYQASTSEMFGKVIETPQSETTPFHPRSPYGVAKVLGHFITVNFRESYGMHASSGILFNHESPLRGAEFVTRKITRGLARLAHGEDAPVELGNLDAERDWGFAGDYVEGMWRMLQAGTADDYVLATGTTTSIRAFIEHACEPMGFAVEWSGAGLDEVGTDTRTGKTLIKVNPQFFRPAEVDRLLGDSSKARSVLGWIPKVDLPELARMMAVADYDRFAQGGPMT